MWFFVLFCIGLQATSSSVRVYQFDEVSATDKRFNFVNRPSDIAVTYGFRACTASKECMHFDMQFLPESLRSIDTKLSAELQDKILAPILPSLFDSFSAGFLTTPIETTTRALPSPVIRAGIMDDSLFWIQSRDQTVRLYTVQGTELLCTRTDGQVYRHAIRQGVRLGKKRLVLSFDGISWHLFDLQGKEILFKQGPLYRSQFKSIIAVGDIHFIVHFMDGSGGLFDSNGNEISCINGPVRSVHSFGDTAVWVGRGTKEFFLCTVHGKRLLPRTFQELFTITPAVSHVRVVGGSDYLITPTGAYVTCTDSQGAIYKKIRNIDAWDDTHFRAITDDYTMRLFHISGREVSLSKKAQTHLLGRHYELFAGMKAVIHRIAGVGTLYKQNGEYAGHFMGEDGYPLRGIQTILSSDVAGMLVQLAGDKRVYVNRAGKQVVFDDTAVILSVHALDKIHLLVKFKDMKAGYFYISGRQIQLFDTKGNWYASVSALVQCGNKLVALLPDQTVHFFDGQGHEIGILRSLNGQPCRGVKLILAIGTSSLLVCDDACMKIYRPLDIKKHFGPITLQKVMFLCAAANGFLQNTYTFENVGTFSLANMYASFSPTAQLLLQQAPYNLPRTFAL